MSTFQPTRIRCLSLVGCLALLAASAPAVQAYINGGGRWKSDYEDYPNRLRAKGWGVAMAVRFIPGTGRVEASPCTAKNMVVQALGDLPDQVVHSVPIETRAELACIAEAAFAAKEVRKGQVGNVEYLVGEYSFRNEQDDAEEGRRYPNRRVTGGADTHSAPFVAVRIVTK